MDILKETKLIGNYIISLRKDFHKYPELSMEEHRTSRRIKEELDKIGPESPVYILATRLKSFLGFFKEIDKDYVPSNSILREFIGGSVFYKY